MADTLLAVRIILVIIAVVLLAYGFHRRTPEGHLLSAGGWLCFGLYWFLRTPPFFEHYDYFNAFFVWAGVLFFPFIAYNEYLISQGRGDIKEDGDNNGLKFLAGTGFIAGGMYFLIEYVEAFNAGLVWITAYQAKLFLALFGYEIELGSILYEDKIRVPILREGHDGTNIFIVLACTAIQSFVIFIGAIYSTQGDRLRKWKAFLITVPVVYFLNIFRNAAVIYLVYEDIVRFEIAHDVYSRWGATLVLMILIYYMFEFLPELHDDVMAVVDLVAKPVKKELVARGLMEEKAPETKETGEVHKEPDSQEQSEWRPREERVEVDASAEAPDEFSTPGSEEGSKEECLQDPEEEETKPL